MKRQISDNNRLPRPWVGGDLSPGHWREIDDLTARARQGEVDAEHELFARLKPMINRALASSRPDLETEQERPGVVYLAFHRLLRSFEPERGVYFTTYLARMLAPAVFSAERSARRYQEHLVENEPQESDRWASSPEQMDPEWEAPQRCILERMDNARILAGLPAQARRIIELRGEGRSFPEIAGDLRSTEGACRKSLDRALKTLRESIQEAR